jgi:gliding motility-associated lipoprotein GldH
MKSKTLLILFLFAVLLNACVESVYYEKDTELTNLNWDINNKLYHEVVINDHLKAYNIYLNIRNTGRYPYSNLYVFLESSSPGELDLKLDTVECILADPTGKWFGSGYGNILYNRVLVYRSHIFPRPGKYIFTLQHAMRMQSVPELQSVGLRIEEL